jgi:hypothetical protein
LVNRRPCAERDRRMGREQFRLTSPAMSEARRGLAVTSGEFR